jgi:hypothetical protein
MASISTARCQLLPKPANKRATAKCPRAGVQSNLALVELVAIAVVGLIGFRLSQGIEQFHQARLVRITRGRLAIWLDPFGMLDPQVIVNLFPQLCAGLDLLKHDH